MGGATSLLASGSISALNRPTQETCQFRPRITIESPLARWPRGRKLANVMRGVAVVLILLLGAGRALGQQGSSPPFFFPDNRAQCREQVARLMTAVNNADAEALRQLIYTRPEREAQRLGAGAVINCIVARRKLEQEMAGRWGAEAPKALGGTSAFPDREREAVATAEVQAFSTEALLYLSPGTTAIELRRTKSGQWRILLRAVELLNDDGQRKPEPGSLQR